MYPVSSVFEDVLRSSNMRSVAKVTTTAGVELSIVDGSVSMDSTRDIQRTCTLELSPTDTMSADDVYTLMRSPGMEVTVWRGLVIDGVEELVPLGVFTTDEADQSKSKTATVKWSGSDRSKKVARNRFVDPYQIPAGTSLATAGEELLASRLDDVAVDFGNVTETVTSNIVFEAGSNSNPWKAIRQVFSDYGYDLRFDGLGVARAVDVPDPATTAAVFDFGSGETSLVLDGDAKASLEQVYNGVIASGEGTDVAVPVRVEVWDDDPRSPTYYLSGFGRVPYFFTSPLLTSEDIARKAASTILARVKGRSQQLSWPALVNPALEPLDVVAVAFGSGASTNCVLDSLTIPLTPNVAMAAKARETAIQ